MTRDEELIRKTIEPQWQYVRFGEERYHDANGKILGNVSRGHDEYIAIANGKTIGRYISAENAKTAVERAIRQLSAADVMKD